MNTLPLTKPEVVAYEIMSHGIEHPEYFQGCGVAFTKYDEVFTGIGDTEHSAIHDALDQSLQIYNWDSKVLDLIYTEIDETSDKELYANEHGNNDIYWHVSVRVKIKENLG